MMLAHYLWQRTPRAASADEATWLSALDQAAMDAAPLMQAIWRALTANERRVARALAVAATPLYSEETASAVGIKRTSIARALEGLTGKADVIVMDGRPRLTDPMFEHWLRERGLTPAGGKRWGWFRLEPNLSGGQAPARARALSSSVARP